jgi:adenosylcobinamide-phosphate synthase
MVTGRALAVAAGLAADRLLGEPPAAWHPVAAYGRTMEAVERRCYDDQRRRGVFYAAVGVGGPALIGWLMERSSRMAGALSMAAATYLAVAGRALGEAAAEVAGPLGAGDLERARERLPALVGRNPAGLDAREVARAVVESVAENTVDAIVAPVLWALTAGPPGVLGYRALNTLDAMVGHVSPRYARFGWASAKADDAAAWVPARVTALLVAAVRPGQAGAVWQAVRWQAPQHPSPNAGVAEAAFAAALGVSLGGTNDYLGRVERRPVLGTGRPACHADIRRARSLSRDVTVALGLACLAISRAGARHSPGRREDR